MNNSKIGVFIAERRKDMGMTQKDLSNKLCVTDRAVSKWECGKGLPDISIMPLLCELLDISINELLDGEKIAPQEVGVKAERQIMELLRERQVNKKKLWMQIAIGIVGIFVLLGSILLASYAITELAIRIITIIFGTAICVVSFIVTIAIDVDTGYYECQECHKRFVPSAKEYVAGVHTFTRRRLKCPHCGEVSMCKKRLGK